MAIRYEITDSVQRTVPGGSPLLLAVAASASAQIKDLQGNNLTVYQAETGSTTNANPVTTDSSGRIEGWVEAPDFDITISGTGITTYTQTIRQSPVGTFNVKSYGAKGDGTTDDKVAIQAAVTAAGSAGVVTFPSAAGAATTYLHTGLTCATGQTWRGDGIGRTILKLKNSANAHCILGDGTSYVRIEGMTVDGNQANQSTGSANNWRGIYFINTSQYIRLRDVHIKNVVDHGVFFSGNGDYSVIEDCLATGCGSSGHIAGGGAGGTGFVGGVATTKWVNCTSDGNYLNGYKGSAGVWSACSAINSTGGGGFENSGSSTRGAKYIGCEATDNVGGGWRLVADGGQVKLSDCEASRNGSAGITILNLFDRVTIDGCTIKNNGTAAGARTSTTGIDGITILSSGANGPNEVIIDNCHIFDDQGSPTQDYGIYVEDATTKLRIGGGNIIGTHKTGILRWEDSADDIKNFGFTGSSAEYRNVTAVTVTGTTSATDLMSTTLKGRERNQGSVIRLIAAGRCTGTAGTKTIRFHMGASSVIFSSQLAAEVQDWGIEATIFCSDGSRQYAMIQSFEDGGTSTPRTLVTTDALTSDIIVKVAGQLGNAADSIICDAMVVLQER